MKKNKLVIVESPAKARTISKFLGKDFTIKASMGHVIDLPVKEIGVDVENHFKPSYKVNKDKEKIIKEIKAAAKDAGHVYLATDEDREGEAIAWHILNALKLKENEYDRIVFHEITNQAIQNAIENPRKINTQLVDAQQARRVLDRLVGYKLSPLLWKKVRKGLSAGRVQSVAVRLIVEKEDQIQKFKKEEYWKVKGVVETDQKKTFSVTLEKIQAKKAKFISEKDILEFLKAYFPGIEFISTQEKELTILTSPKINIDLTVTSLTRKKLKKSPPPPFITSTLQQEAHRKFGFSVAHTMRLAQQLYEGVDLKNGRTALITYMRTDSVNLANEALENINVFVKAKYGEKYSLKSHRKYKTKAKGAQEAHEAIRPIDVRVTPESISGQIDSGLSRLYTLIWNRTVATQMSDAEFENTNIRLSYEKDRNKAEFSATGKVITKEGFMKLYIEGTDHDPNAIDEDDKMLPAVKEGEIVCLKELQSKQSFTKPPARYTEASLVKKLEGEGIGRPSTYAPTISNIIDRGYIEKENKHLKPTDIAFIVNKFLVENFKDVIDYKFTAHVEEDFDDIASGNSDWVKILGDFYAPFEEQINDTLKNAPKYVEETDEKCPECGNKIIIRLSKYGKFYSCSNFPDCRYTKNLDGDRQDKAQQQLTDEKCPQCRKQLALKKGRYGSFLACSGYPECKYIKKGEKKVVKAKGCPTCGGDIVEKRTRRGKPFFGCDNYPKCKYAVWKKEDLDATKK